MMSFHQYSCLAAVTEAQKRICASEVTDRAFHQLGRILLLVGMKKKTTFLRAEMQMVVAN